MTKGKAIAMLTLRKYRRDIFRCNPRYLVYLRKDYQFLREVYTDYLIDELIQRIMASDDPPVKVVDSLYSMLDDVLAESEDDHFHTHGFASIMEQACGDILFYLKKEEENETE